MSVNIYDGTNLTPIAGKTVPAPTPDYVDEQYNSATTYSKGMTCISGNVRYRYKNSTATSGHRPPDTTYWEVWSVSDQIAKLEVSGWNKLTFTRSASIQNNLLKSCDEIIICNPGFGARVHIVNGMGENSTFGYEEQINYFAKVNGNWVYASWRYGWIRSSGTIQVRSLNYDSAWTDVSVFNPVEIYYR